MSAIQYKACSKPRCDNFGKPGISIVGHGWFTTKSGRRRRYRCKIYGGTVSTNTSTAYSGLRCTRREFDQVASLRVEGVSISATARVTGHSRNTIARWLERRLVKILERPVGQQVAPFQGLLESGIAVGYVFLPGAQFVACSSPGASAIKCCYAVFEC